MSLALFLPITSKNKIFDLEKLVLPKKDINLYIIIDDDDQEYNKYSNENFSDIFNINSKNIYINFIKGGTFQAYKIYNKIIVDVALKNKENEYFVLWGDDIVTENDNWLPCIKEKFNLFKDQDIPFGYGCVALNDIKNPGFPSFPVVHRNHIELFNGFCPNKFITNDGDPWVFELYRYFGTSTFATEVIIENKIGGASYILDSPDIINKSRYNVINCNWRDNLIKDVQTVENKLGITFTKTTLDVIIPTFRTDLNKIKKIIKMDIPYESDVMFIIIVDNPSTLLKNELIKLSNDYLPKKIRIRFNYKNVGASISRNRGLDESSSEWTLFLDDDVIVQKDLLSEYIKNIKKYGKKYCGFVGNTKMPNATNYIQSGVEMSYITYFYSISEKFNNPAWGVTANICLKRPNKEIRFKDYIKTGGGEDIKYCLDIKNKFNQELKSVKSAICVHPWWIDGLNNNINIFRFFSWTQGDGYLMYDYPEYCYVNYINIIELSFLSLVLSIFDPNILKLLIIFWIIEFAIDIHHFIFVDKLTAKNNDLNRFYCSILSTIIKNIVDFGHTYFHLKKLDFSKLFIRFDWFCKTYKQGVLNEQKKSLLKFILNLLVTCIFYKYLK